jgi:hypothetical protein
MLLRSAEHPASLSTEQILDLLAQRCHFPLQLGNCGL